MIKNFLIITALLTTSIFAGLPPTTSKINGDTSKKTTFDFEFPNFTGTHTGSKVSVTGATTLPVSGDVTLTGSQFNNLNIGHNLAYTQSTGLTSGGILSINVDNTKFDISAYNLNFSDYTSNSDTPVIKDVNCPSLSAQSVTSLASADSTYILANPNCSLSQQTTFPTPSERRAKVFIGRIGHSNRTTISGLSTTPNFIIDPTSQLYDVIDAIGAFNISGNVISPNGSNLSINKSLGKIFRRGANYSTNDQDPHEVSLPAQTAASFLKSTSTTTSTSLFTVMDVGNYDVAGTITAIPGGGSVSTNRRVYIFSTGRIVIQYGQVTYPNLASAVASAGTEAFTVAPSIAEGGVLLSIVSCRKGATNASLSSDCVFSKVSRFDSSGVSAGSTSVATMQSSYDNSASPQITTSTTNGSIDIKRGSASDTDSVIRILNGSGTSTASVAGSGAITTSSSITATGAISTSGGNISAPTGVINGSALISNSGISAVTLVSTPLVVGGSSTTQSLTLKPTSGAGTTGSDLIFQVGNSGGTEAMRVLNTGSIGVGTATPNANAILDISSTTKAFMPPRMTTTQKNAIASPTAGMVVYDSTLNAVSFYDGTQWLSNLTLASEVAYTARFTDAGVLTSTSKIGWASSSSTAPYYITFQAGLFNVTPACFAQSTASSVNAVPYAVFGATTSGVSMDAILTQTGVRQNISYNLTCFKQGADATNSSTSAILGSNADFGPTPATFTLSNAGNATVTGTVSRKGDMALFKGRVVIGSSLPTGSITLNLPAGFSMANTSRYLFSTIDNSTNNYQGTAYATSSTTINFYGPTSVSAWNATTPVTWAASNYFDFNIYVEISGWTQSPYAIVPLAGAAVAPGYSGQVDTLAFGFGTGNISTECTASPCFVDQIGTGVSSVTRTSTGVYVVNTARTYSKLRCTVQTNGYTVGAPMCNNCSSVGFGTFNSSVVATDRYGSVICIGSY